jgi:hypothetical protein
MENPLAKKRLENDDLEIKSGVLSFYFASIYLNSRSFFFCLNIVLRAVPVTRAACLRYHADLQLCSISSGIGRQRA